MTAQPTYRDFADDVLKATYSPVTPPNRRALAAVFIMEGVNHYWNPMNWVTPENYPTFNSAGVRMYPSFAVGVTETAKALNIGGKVGNRWEDVMRQFRAKHGTRLPVLESIQTLYASWGSHVNLVQFDVAHLVARLDMRMQGS